MTRLPSLLLFDVDGTLLLAGGAGARAMQAVGRRLFHPGFEAEHHDTAGKLDHVIFAELMEINDLTIQPHHPDAFREAYLAELETQLARSRDRFRILPGVPELLAALRQRAERQADVVLGLLTGNYAGAIPIKFAAAGIDPGWFSVTASSEDGRRREDLTAAAMSRYAELVGQKPDPARVIVIGDTPHDVACAKAHGCKALGVATGRYDVAELLHAGADAAVEDLTCPTVLWAWLDA